MKSILPHIKIMAATGNKNELAPYVDVWIPLFDNVRYLPNPAFYSGQQQIGKEAWFYTSCDPLGHQWISRHVEAAALNTRYHHWVNYKYRLTGHYYWSFNEWLVGGTNIIDNAGGQGALVPAGDHFVVYPGYRKVYSTIRLAAHRDGIADYELLKLLEKTNKSKSDELANRMIRGATDYEKDISKFRAARRELLEALSN